MKKIISLILVVVATMSLVSCEDELKKAMGEAMLNIALSDMSDKTEIEGGYLHWAEIEGGYELTSATIVIDKKKFTAFEIPSEFNGKPVVSIGNAAFFCWSDLETITIPETVTRIGDGAFAFCSSLKSIVIPNSVTYLGEEVFKGCSSLENVTLPEEITVITSNMFELGAFSMTIKLGSKVEVIEDRAFCNMGTTIYVGKSLKKIYYTAFSGMGTIIYDGTMEEWMQVERLVGEREEEESDYSIFIHCIDGTIMTSNTIDHWVAPEGFLGEEE